MAKTYLYHSGLRTKGMFQTVGGNLIALGTSYLDYSGGYFYYDINAYGFDYQYDTLLNFLGDDLVVGKAGGRYAFWNNTYVMEWEVGSTISYALTSAFGLRGESFTVDFAANTGARKTKTDSPDVQALDNLQFLVSNGGEQNRVYVEPGSEGKYTGSAPGDVKTICAYGISITGTLTVAGSFDADMISVSGGSKYSGKSLCVYDSTLGFGYSYKTDDKTGEKTLEKIETSSFNFSENHKIESKGIVAGAALVINNNMSGTINDSIQNYKFSVQHLAYLSNNALAAYGIQTGNLTVKGVWENDAGVDSAISNISFIVDQNDMKQSRRLKDGQVEFYWDLFSDHAGMTENTLNTYGISAENIVLNSAGKESQNGNGVYYTTSDGAISSSIKNVSFVCDYYQEELKEGEVSKKYASALLNNTMESIAVKGTSLDITGYFAEKVNSEISGIDFRATSGSVIVGNDSYGTFSFHLNNSANAGGIVLSGALTAANTFGGEINVTNDSAFFLNKSFGIYARSVTVVNGLFDADVNVSASNGFRNLYVDTSEQIQAERTGWCKFEGICAEDELIAEALSGNVVVKADVWSECADIVGVRAKKFSNNNDGIFDINGSISVVSGAANCIAITNRTAAQESISALNLRISGEVYSKDSAVDVMYGVYTETNDKYRSAYHYRDYVIGGPESIDDRIEVAAGGVVQGDLDLNAGTNTVILDSNAYVNGDILFDQGKLNLFYRLNSKAMDGVVSQAPRGAGILNISDTVFDSRTHITVDMNDAAVGEYILISDAGSSTNWYDRSIDITFQGLTQLGLKGYSWSTYSDDKNNYIQDGTSGITGVIQVNGGSLYVKDRNGADVFKVSCSIKGSGYKQQIVLKVDAVPAVQDCVFKDLSELSQNLNYEGHTATLSWSDDEAIQNTKYIVEYRYVTTDADGNVEVGNSIEIETLERTVSVSLAANQQLEWRVRQSLADRVNVGEWNSFQNILTDLKTEEGSNGAILSWNDAAKGSGTKYLLAYKTITYDSKGEAVYSNLITKVVSDSQYTVEGFSARNVEWKVGRVIDGTSDTVQEWSAYNSFDVIDPVLNAKFNTSETGDSSVAFLEWDTPVTATAGVQKYVIQYFQAQAKYSEEEASAMMDNGEVSYAQVECTNTRFVVSGLNNTEHTYWRIKAVDNVGNETDWTLGKSFRNDTYDTESPYFPAEKPVSIEYAWTANEKGGKNFGVNFSWTQAADASSGIYAYVLRYRKSSSTEESDWKEITTTVKEAEALKYSLNLDLDNENYSWEFYAADWVGNKSEALKGSFLTDTLAPVISGGLTLSTPYSFEDKAMYVQLGWNAAKDQSGSDDNASGVAYYEISISGKNTAGQDVVVTEKLNDPSQTSYEAVLNEQNLRELGFVSGQGFTFGTYTFSIRAVDHAGNVSESYSYEPITAYLNLDGSFTSLAKPTIEATSIGYLLANYTLFTSAKATFDLSKNTISSPGGAALTYTIQISDSARFNTENTYEFETAETSFVLDGSTIGKGSGMLCNMDQVYWRVKVTDANGVCTDWKNGETFAFRDENGLKIVNQYFKPDFIISTSISDIVPDFEGTGDNTHYKFLSWEGGEEEGFGIKYYLVTVKDSAGTVTEFASTDVYNGENGWIVKDIPHEGECTWTVKSVNYQGLTSNTFTGGKFVYDVTAPVFDTKSVKGECYGSVVDISWNAATDNIQMKNYLVTFITIGAEGSCELGHKFSYVSKDGVEWFLKQNTTYYENVSWYETTDLRFIQKNLADGDYVVLIHAVDAENNLSDVFVAGCTVNVGTGPGYDFETALELNESYNTYDAVVGKLGQKTDYYTFTYGKAADIVFAVSDMYVFQDGGAANVKISIYDETYTEIFSTTVSTDQGAYLHHHVFEAGTYYATVTSLNQDVSVGYAISTYRFATSVKSNLQNNGTSQIVAWDSAKGTVGYMANDGFYAPEWKGVWEWGSADASQWKVAGVGKFAGSSVDHDGILLYNKGSNTLAAWTNLSDGSYGYQSLCWVGNNVEVRGLTNQDNNGLDDVLVTDKNGSFGVIIDGMTYHDIWHSESAESNPWTLIGAGNFGGEQDSLLVYNKLEGAYYLWDNKDTSFAAWQWDSKPVAQLSDEWKVSAIGDFAGDGIDDIVIWNSNTGDVLMLNDGKNETQHWTGTLNPNTWEIAAAGDYDGDGKDDLLLRELSSGWGGLGYWREGYAGNWVDMNARIETNKESSFSIIAQC